VPPRIDVCDWTAMIYHPICMTGAGTKSETLKNAGMWLLEDQKDCLVSSGISKIETCRPLLWSNEQAESQFQACADIGYSIALTYIERT